MTATKHHVEKTLDDLVAAFIREFDHDRLLAYCREYEVETNFDTTLGDDWPDESDRCAIELAESMVKAYENNAIKESGLGAVVEKLPVTADKVRVAPGDIVWKVCNGVLVGLFVVYYVKKIIRSQMAIEGEWLAFGDFDGFPFGSPVNETFSTPSAAKSAATGAKP